VIPFPDKKYKVIYADPPWQYRQKGNGTSNGLAGHHYATLTTKEISNLPINDIKTDDSICFMWATFPFLQQALEVMKAWGFEYKTTAFVWVKKNKKSDSWFWGTGNYTRTNAEICLLGTSKDFRANQMIKSHSVHQIVDTRIEEHSKKPSIVRDLIVELCGDQPRIELFARQKVDGWDIWGNEAPIN
jgi:N6-adenosine-specific RNA methylase IME4